METRKSEGLSSGVVWIVAICAAVAAAPWFSGGQEPIALLLSGVATLVGAYLLWRQPAVRAFKSGPLLWFYLAFAGWALLSLSWTVNRYSSVIWLIPLLLAGLVFRLVYSVAREEQGRNKMVGLYLGTAIIFCAYGLWLYLTGGYERFTSSFYWANPAAAYLIPAILVSLEMMLGSTNKWPWGALTLIFGSCFALTDSRAALAVLVLTLVVYVIVTKLNWRQWLLLVLSIVGVYALSTGLVQLRRYVQPKAVLVVPGARLAETASGESQSSSDRLHYIESALKITADHPLLGTGAGTFGDVHPRYQGRIVSASTSVHNYFIQSLSELGIIGFILLLLLFGAVVSVVLRGALQRPGNVPLILSLAALTLHAALDIDMRYPAYVILMAILIGLLAGQRQSNPRQLSWRVPVAALMLLLPIIALYEVDALASRAAIYQENNEYDLAANAYGGTSVFIIGNPDWIGAAGINRFTLASSGAPGAAKLVAQALSDARTAQRLDPRDGQHHQLEARLLALKGDLAGAERASQAALSLDPYNHPEYALDLAQIHLYQNLPTEAITTAQAMLVLYPDQVLANRASDARLRPTLANLAALVGNEYLRQGRVAEALTYADLSVHYYPKSTRGRALKHQLELRAAQP